MSPSGTTLPFGPNRANDRSGSIAAVHQCPRSASLMGPDGAFITGSDFLMDGGVTAAYWFGEPAPK